MVGLNVCLSISVILLLLLLSCVRLWDPMDCSPPGSPVEFPRQEYWSGLPFPSPEDLPDPGIKPVTPVLQTNSLPLSPLKAHFCDKEF